MNSQGGWPNSPGGMPPSNSSGTHSRPGHHHTPEPTAATLTPTPTSATASSASAADATSSISPSATSSTTTQSSSTTSTASSSTASTASSPAASASSGSSTATLSSGGSYFHSGSSSTSSEIRTPTPRVGNPSSSAGSSSSTSSAGSVAQSTSSTAASAVLDPVLISVIVVGSVIILACVLFIIRMHRRKACKDESEPAVEIDTYNTLWRPLRRFESSLSLGSSVHSYATTVQGTTAFVPGMAGVKQITPARNFPPPSPSEHDEVHSWRGSADLDPAQAPDRFSSASSMMAAFNQTSLWQQQQAPPSTRRGLSEVSMNFSSVDGTQSTRTQSSFMPLMSDRWSEDSSELASMRMMSRRPAMPQQAIGSDVGTSDTTILDQDDEDFIREEDEVSTGPAGPPTLSESVSPDHDLLTL